MDGESFCPEHMHFESSRVIQMLNDIGSKIDWSSRSYHVACGMVRRVMKPGQVKQYYEYCPSLEGLLPAWLEQVDHLTRWLTVCFEVFEDDDANGYNRFPFHLFHRAFPEIVDIDNHVYYHAYWSTYDMVKAYGFNIHRSWERNVPALLHQLGCMQQFIPYHQAVDAQVYQEGERFVFRTGIEDNTYAKDLFDFGQSGMVPKSPALKLKWHINGTSSPSWDGMEDIKPAGEVNFCLNLS